jgi:hypothetical protein
MIVQSHCGDVDKLAFQSFRYHHDIDHSGGVSRRVIARVLRDRGKMRREGGAVGQ